jgi:hypothetical protein
MGARPESSKLERQLARLEGYHAVEQELARRRPARVGRPRFEDLSLAIPEERRARLDRSDVDVSSLDQDEHAYWRDGFLIKEGLIPDDLTERYWRERIAIDDRGFSAWGGSYMAMPSMQDVCLYAPLVSLVEKLVGEPLAMFLSLSGVQSSQREWHQDFYLKPGYENTHYCAVWIAVGDVDPASGPFEYAPGSHRLDPMRKELVDEWLTPEERTAVTAPRIAERFVTGACCDLIAERGLQVRQFVPRQGDVLIWHHSLLHQGSRQRDFQMLRPGVIAHFNSIRSLEMCNKTVRRTNGGAFVERADADAVRSSWRSSQPLVAAAKAQQAGTTAAR